MNRVCLAEVKSQMSSANWERWTLYSCVGDGRSETYSMNRIGLMELPWGTPWLRVM